MFQIINDCQNSEKFYIQLPDGYRLIFSEGKYLGRYNPNM